MRILVTGAAGMLGSAVVPELVQLRHQVLATDIALDDPRPWGTRGPTLGYLDVRERQAIADAFEVFRPEMVVHLAAETDLETCELDPAHAYRTNTVATLYVASACERASIPLAYVSTAGVFDGTKEGPYDESDEPRPLNVYGHSKLEGEHIVHALLDEVYTVRAGWMVGGGASKDHKFTSHIVGQLRDGADRIYAVTDKLGAPTYAPDFARCFGRLIGTGAYGLYHMVCEGSGSRFDVARAILDTLGRHDVELVPVGSEHFAERFFAPRPRSEVMANLALDALGLNDMRPWQDAVAEYLVTSFDAASLQPRPTPAAVS